MSCQGRKPAGTAGPGDRVGVVSGHSANQATSSSLSNCCQMKPAMLSTSSTRVIGGTGGNMAGPAAQAVPRAAVANGCIADDDIANGYREIAANGQAPWSPCRTMARNFPAADGGARDYFSSKLLSIHAVFSWSCMRWVS